MQGSPPRMRGKAILRSSPAQLVGITPAYAGKRSACSPPSPHSRDHPRVCGEKWNKLHFGEDCQGSPPRVRGKVVSFLKKRCCIGITPACAGKRCKHYYIRMCKRDHPRVCGEKAHFRCSKFYKVGSPPRVRGKEIFSLLFWYSPGITPACAGKSSNFKPGGILVQDHPRVCGEKSLKMGLGVRELGSPPRVRGKVCSR